MTHIITVNVPLPTKTVSEAMRVARRVPTSPLQKVVVMSSKGPVRVELNLDTENEVVQKQIALLDKFFDTHIFEENIKRRPDGFEIRTDEYRPYEWVTHTSYF